MFRFTIRDVLWLTVVVALGVGRSVQTNAQESGPTLNELLRQLSDAEENKPYSRARAAKYYLEYHSGPKWHVHHRVLVVSWFIRNLDYALRYEVNVNGYSHDVRDVYNHAKQAGRDRTLTVEEFESLKVLLPKLPESKAEPPIERTVHVSFQDGDKWRTETYDTATLPDEFEQIVKILGERFETKDHRHKAKAK